MSDEEEDVVGPIVLDTVNFSIKYRLEVENLFREFSRKQQSIENALKNGIQVLKDRNKKITTDNQALNAYIFNWETDKDKRIEQLTTENEALKARIDNAIKFIRSSHKEYKTTMNILALATLKGEEGNGINTTSASGCNRCGYQVCRCGE